MAPPAQAVGVGQPTSYTLRYPDYTCLKKGKPLSCQKGRRCGAWLVLSAFDTVSPSMRLSTDPEPSD